MPKTKKFSGGYRPKKKPAHKRYEEELEEESFEERFNRFNREGREPGEYVPTMINGYLVNARVDMY